MSWCEIDYQTSPRKSQFYFSASVRLVNEFNNMPVPSKAKQQGELVGPLHLLNMSFCETTVISFASIAVGDKVMKDIRPGVPFEPTYIYKLLTLTKSSLSEKVSSLIAVLVGFRGLIRCVDIFENVCVSDPSSLSRKVWRKLRNVWIYHAKTFFLSDCDLKVRSL